MNQQTVLRYFLVICMFVICSPSVFSQESVLERAASVQAIEKEISPEVMAAAAGVAASFSKTFDKELLVVPNTHGCSSSGSLSCNQTLNGTVSNHGCVTNDQTKFFNLYTFTALQGQRVTLRAESTQIDTEIVVFDGQAREIGRNDDSEGGLNSRFDFNVTQSGEFAVGVYAVRTVRPSTGSFTISLVCSSTGSACTPNSTTLCLSNGRFRVQTRWATPNGQSGDGNAVSITGDTGYFWFFNSTNVEMVVKVLNACPSRYWVFAGGLTNVQVTMTVTDTSSGTVSKTYTNPQGTAFQPIQDTNAFATCP